MLCLMCQPGHTEAAETETETEQKQEVSAVSRTGEPGWHTEGTEQYYYSSKGKLCTGWVKIQGKYYYFRRTTSGARPAGSMVKGFQKIGSKRFYFSKTGQLQTGWKKISGKYYYFESKGGVGVLGRTYTGYKVIGSGRYFFHEKGYALTGWQTYKKYKYYCADTAKAGSYGKAYAGGWKEIEGTKYYFSKNSILQTNRWVGSYYVDEEGRRLTNTVTPDGWIVNKDGKKTKQASGWISMKGNRYYYKNGVPLTGWRKIGGKRYYFNEEGIRQTGLQKIGTYTYYLGDDGVRQTGWVRIEGRKYYFDSNGRMAVDTTVDGIKVGTEGYAEDFSVLIIAGHGQGDVGASSMIGNTTYLEYTYTRQFASLIYEQLKDKNPHLSVVMYDPDYDCYQVMAGKKAGPSPHFEAYDYVLEIHFNATVASMKDLKGDGIYKGSSIYINSAKKDYKLEIKMLNALVNSGFKQFGCGVFGSTGLLNAKTCQAKGVSYGLLETAFIDDRDDMKYYLKHKESMAKAVAGVILDYFSV